MKRLRVIRRKGLLEVLDLDARSTLSGVRAVELDLEEGAPAILRIELVEIPGALEVEADVEVGEPEEEIEDDSDDEAAESLRASFAKARDLDDE